MLGVGLVVLWPWEAWLRGSEVRGDLRLWVLLLGELVEGLGESMAKWMRLDVVIRQGRWDLANI